MLCNLSQSVYLYHFGNQRDIRIIYKASYDMTLSLFHVIKKYPKEFKYTLWDQIKKNCLELISTIYRANSLFDKIILIQLFRWYLQSLRVLLRLSKDLHIVSIEKFVFIQENIESISKQKKKQKKKKKKKK